MIRCPKCRWAKVTTGREDEIKDLSEVKNSCTNCGKPRTFRCPLCGSFSQMKRLVS
jgi:hypothetical protein